MKRFGICIVILTIIFTILLRMDKYCDCENFIFNTTMIIKGNYYLVAKEDMKVVEVSALQWYYTNFISFISLVLWILTGLLYLYVMGRHVLPYFWYKKHDHMFDES